MCIPIFQFRPAIATVVSLADFCWWSTQKADVEFLSVIACIVLAFWGVVLAHRRSVTFRCPQWPPVLGFCSHGSSSSGDKYLLVIKDDASKLVWLFPTPDPTAVFVKDYLLQWFAIFGICYD